MTEFKIKDLPNTLSWQQLENFLHKTAKLTIAPIYIAESNCVRWDFGADGYVAMYSDDGSCFEIKLKGYCIEVCRLLPKPSLSYAWVAADKLEKCVPEFLFVRQQQRSRNV